MGEVDREAEGSAGEKGGAAEPVPVPGRDRVPPPRKRPRRSLPRAVRWPPFDIEEILAWADAFYRRTGDWPGADSGEISERPPDSWRSVESALRLGLRGLPGKSSLAQLLSERRSVRNRKRLPPFTEEQ